jgi:hypothetical protein
MLLKLCPDFVELFQGGFIKTPDRARNRLNFFAEVNRCRFGLRARLLPFFIDDLFDEVWIEQLRQ